MLFTPYFSGNRGNSTTTKRIVDGLIQNGLEVSVFAYEEEIWTETIQAKVNRCDIIHVIHFYRFSSWLQRNEIKLTKPYILTSGGTDVNHYIFEEKYSEEMIDVLQNAKVITVFTEDAKKKMNQVYEGMNLSIEVIPQSIWFPKDRSQAKNVQLPEGNPRVLLPSGLRDVKDIFFLMDELKGLQEKYHDLQFLITGMVLDQEILSTLKRYMIDNSWIHFIENVPIEMMPTIYTWADYVLNTSISEGQSSALLEAMDMGCLVFARNNPGNASIIKDGENGYLFSSGDEFLEKFENVLHDIQTKERIRTNAKQYIQVQHDFNNEILSYIKVYKKCLEHS